MKDVEALLSRTLLDERRALGASAVTVRGVERASRRLQLRRTVAVAAAALASVALIAGGTMFADGSAARDGKPPSYETTASAQPRTS